MATFDDAESSKPEPDLLATALDKVEGTSGRHERLIKGPVGEGGRRRRSTEAAGLKLLAAIDLAIATR